MVRADTGSIKMFMSLVIKGPFEQNLSICKENTISSLKHNSIIYISNKYSKQLQVKKWFKVPPKHTFASECLFFNNQVLLILKIKNYQEKECTEIGKIMKSHFWAKRNCDN